MHKVNNPLKGNPRSGIKFPKDKQNGMFGKGDSDIEDRTRSQRFPQSRSFISYGKPVTLKLPELNSQTAKGENKNTSRNSIKSTKQSLENAAKSHGIKVSTRLTLEIDKKLENVGRSVTEFEKTNRSFMNKVQNAVRKSEVDASHNRKVSSQQISSDSHYKKFVQELEEEDKEMSELTEAADLVVPRSCSKLFGHDPIIPIHVIESSESALDSDSSDLLRKRLKIPSQISSDRKKRLLTRLKYLDWNEDEDKLRLDPIMPNLSDKAFQTNLKKQGGKSKEKIQDIRTQINAINQKVEIDKKKANLLPNKLLYNPRRTANRVMGFSSSAKIKGPRTELIDFIQTSGGHTGSWNPRDHEKFLDLYRQFKDQPDKLISNIIQETSKSAKEVMAHVKWYEKYNSLAKANQDQLRKWDMEKRQDRQMIYQMASEGQRTKLEDEKRRQDHLKNKREEEKLRSRTIVSQWKKLQDSGIFKDSIKEPSNVDFEELQQEMLDLANKVQSIDKPNSKKLRPPPKLYSNNRGVKNPLARASSYRSSSKLDISNNELKDNKAQHSNGENFSEQSIVGSIEKVKGNIISEVLDQYRSPSPDKFEGIEGKIHNLILERNRFETEDRPVSSESEIKTESIVKPKMFQPFPTSKLTTETLTHKIRSHGQKLKRMELNSLSSRKPDRFEDSQVWGTSGSLTSFGMRNSVRAIPSWRKM